ncbi:MAG: hypothetical protein ABMB14_05615 [Myxococcota bacterium]
MRGAWLVWIAAASGCTTWCDCGGPQDTVMRRLLDPASRILACGDLEAFVVDPTDTAMLRIALAHPLEDAAGAETRSELTLPDATASVQIEEGSDLSAGACDDVVEEPGPDVVIVWEAAAGALTVDLRPSDDGDRADLTLEDCTFDTADGAEFSSNRAVHLLNLAVGWFPG